MKRTPAGNGADPEVPAAPVTRSTTAATSAAEVRERIEEALRLDLVGPGPEPDGPGGDLAEELLPRRVRPSNWYLTGFLVPDQTPPDDRADPDEDDDSTGEVAEDAGLPEESADEHRAAKRGFFPSSMGLSFLVPEAARELEVVVSWGDYAAAELPPAKPGDDPRPVWRRTPRREELTLPLGPTTDERIPVPDARGLELHRVERVLTAGEVGSAVPDATRAVSLFLVNRRTPASDRSTDAFQTGIEVRCAPGFLGRPQTGGASSGAWDEEVANLHYRDTLAFATGHGVSADWDLVDGRCLRVRTAWIPRAEVERIKTVEISGLDLSMAALTLLEEGDAVRECLGPLVVHYRDWIEERRGELDALSTGQRETAEELLRLAAVAASRMERGIAVLADDAEALDAFRIANAAVLLALKQRTGLKDPKWRAFQLAFLLLNLPGLADPADPDREVVDLLFFPTGGGKTEAYLGLAAFAMVLRRLRHPEAGGRAGAGVSVIMRYTLRLLTFDQLGRASALVCALELLRERAPERYGEWPFEIGLWVGKGATANRMGHGSHPQPDTARARVNAFKTNPQSKPSPIPLRNCPWCGAAFSSDSFELTGDANNPTDLRILCLAGECYFGGERGLPIVTVDEPLYRRLPAFLVATVDKFASLPWVGVSGALLGGADRYRGEAFWRGTSVASGGERLPAPLPPPDLIVQDELHLIAGPLGTMAGLYEAAIEALASRAADRQTIRPKIVASTATANRAQDQVQALFGRGVTQCFPPPGHDRQDSFFARQVPAAVGSARRYLGIAAPGRNPKVVMRRVLLPLMAAAHHEFVAAGGRRNPDNPADPYLTTLGYFNALRELGGARRILEEEVQSALFSYGARRRIGERGRRFRDRKWLSDVLELTSRISTDKVAKVRERLNRSFTEDEPVDWVLATNMISVGLDVQRLGLMVVVGQPKTNAEYIQATSRVGRDEAKPGLVLTLLNIHKPRDRSHYERFRHFHETFYRTVEPGSITPFAARALDRGFAGALVTLARHGTAKLTPPAGAAAIAAVRDAVDVRARKVFLNRVEHQRYEDEDELRERQRSVENRIGELLDAWRNVAEELAAEGVGLSYQRYEDAGGAAKSQPLLRGLLDREFLPEETRRFRAGRSLRDVEPEVRLRLVEPTADPAGERAVSRDNEGTVRCSQLITTFGVGSLVDLPRRSVIVGGLDHWRPGSKDGFEEIVEPRLSRKLVGFTGGGPPSLYAPPAVDSFPVARGGSVAAFAFPRWFVAQDPAAGEPAGPGDPRSRPLVPRSRLDEKHWYDGRPVVATRFVRACPKGHVDDLDWYGFVHRGESDCRAPLSLVESGTTGDLSDIRIRCACGRSRPISDAKVEGPLGPCRGARPWLGKNAGENCDKQARLLIRTASNAWFPQIVSVLSLPERGSVVDEAVAALWDELAYVDQLQELAFVRKKPKGAALGSFSDAEVLEAITRRRAGAAPDRPVKAAELDELLASPEGFGEDVPVNPDFHARALPRNVWSRSGRFDGMLERVVQVHRLREVMALAGFTRFEAVMPDIDGEYRSDVTRAAIALEQPWLPAVENRGEGIFLLLDPDALGRWEARPEVRARLAQLAAGHERWKQRRQKEHGFPGGLYLLVHTLAHLLLQSVALRCGYPAASIRERIYVDAERRRAGLLLYTASPDAEGTLGGLVAEARRVEDHLAAALDGARLCSNDPVCALHEPENTLEQRWLHGAACHGCALIAETSCEMRNEHLDRALVAPVIGDGAAAFFGVP